MTEDYEITRDQVMEHLNYYEAFADSQLRDSFNELEWKDKESVLEQFDECFWLTRRLVGTMRDLMEYRIEREEGTQKAKELANDLIDSSVRLLDTASRNSTCPHCFAEFYSKILFGFITAAREYDWLADHLDEVQ